MKFLAAGSIITNYIHWILLCTKHLKLNYENKALKLAYFMWWCIASSPVVASSAKWWWNMDCQTSRWVVWPSEGLGASKTVAKQQQ